MSDGKHKVELLAPAGSMEAFLGAIHAGADAVYVGGEKFSARAYADNLNTENLCSCIRYAHLFGRRVYLTLNTLIKEAEFSEIYDFVLPLYEVGLDGVILQDFGVLSLLRREFPGLLLHASTQMAITGPDIVPWCREHGISRIVPARELSLRELKEIRDAGIEVECFVHGAMCYCYSGMCLMSSILGGRSGNRGRCAQPCRLPYDAEGDGFHTKDTYPLSLKDMCTIDYLPQLIEAGMTSFKIEGRMKRSEYAAGVTSVYRKYIDLYYAQPDQPFHVSGKDRDVLNRLYIRSDAQDGYLFRQNGREMVTMEKPGYEEVPQDLMDRIRHEHLEQKLSYPVSMRAEFHEGKAAKLCLKAEMDTAVHGIEVFATGPVVEHAQKLPSSEEAVEKQLAKLGNTFFTLQDLDITIEGDVFLPNGTLNQLRRDGISKLENAIINGFFPELEQRKVSSDNGQVDCLRSCVTDRMQSSQQIEVSGKKVKSKEEHAVSQTGLSVSVNTPQQLRACLTHPLREHLKMLYVSEDCLKDFKPAAEAEVRDCVLVLPYIARSKDRAHLTGLFYQAKKLGIHSLLVRNLEELGLIRELHMEGDFVLIADASLYCWNGEAKLFLAEDFARITLPYELNSRETRTFADEKTERIIYGYIPLMQTANCLYRTCKSCLLKQKKSDLSSTDWALQYAENIAPAGIGDTSADMAYAKLHGNAVLTDRLGKQFQVVTDCRYCFNTIYNSVPLSLHNKIDMQKGENYRLQFTIESAAETTEILDYYQSWFTNRAGRKPASFPCSEFTTAHENRQVE
ncbi:MAG: U32 family peptidase [Lachnospiraceae bacterium]|nr:U32 family peptidase [Lachnospiraceae bacterium]